MQSQLHVLITLSFVSFPLEKSMPMLNASLSFWGHLIHSWLILQASQSDWNYTSTYSDRNARNLLQNTHQL